MDDSRLIQLMSPPGSTRVISTAYRCESYFEKLRGLTFRSSLPDGRGLFLVESKDSRVGTAIHMWAVFFEIGVLWINSELRIVDKVLARPWRVYAPGAPAKYILEDTPEVLKRVEIGHRIEVIPYEDTG